MKKGLLIMILTILILSFSKVKAMSLDGILDRELATNNVDYQFYLFDLGLGGGANSYRYEQEFDFGTSFTPNGATYAVFPIEGITYSIGNLRVQDFQIKVYLKSDKNYAMCEIQNNLITCGLDQQRTYTGIKFWLRPITYFSSGDEWDIEYRVNRNVSLYKTNSDEIIDNQNQNHEEFMNTNQTYEDKLDENLEGANETGEFHLREQELMNETRVNETWLDNLANEITINPNASSFIWDIVGGLRSMSPAIITVMTSILGLGIIKMILNR